MAPPKPFDPNDPSTWPKLTPKQIAEMQAKAGYKPLTGKKPTGTPVQPDTNMYNAGTMDVLRGAGNALIKAGDFVFKEPAKSAMRTLNTQNLQTALNPRSTATQRINAIGEDAMNVVSFLPGARAGLNFVDDALRNLALRKSIRNASVPEIYDYGIHISENPKIKNFINSAGRENTSGYADDAMQGSTYQWTLTPQRAYPGEISFDQIADEGAWNAKNWTNDRDSTAYLTRFPMSRSYVDENFLDQYGGFDEGEFDDLFSFPPSTRTEGPMEIVDSKRLLLPNQSALGEKNAIIEMLNKNKREIALNNKRNQYKNFGDVLKFGDPRYNDAFQKQAELSMARRQRIGGPANLGQPPLPDWSSLTPDEMGFATILNRNTPAEEVKRLYIQHNLEMEKSLNQGMRDIAEAMAERSGMDITRAYDFAEDYQKWQRRGGRNPGSN